MDIDIYQLLELYSIFISSLINIVGKVQVFWENLQRCFDVTKYVMSKKFHIISNFVAFSDYMNFIKVKYLTYQTVNPWFM